MSWCPLIGCSLVVCLALEQLMLFSFCGNFKRNISPRICVCLLAFLDINCVPHEILWWAMQHFGIPEWLVNTVQDMNTYTSIKVWVYNSLNNSLKNQGGIHQRSASSLFPFIIMFEALPRESALVAPGSSYMLMTLSSLQAHWITFWRNCIGGSMDWSQKVFVSMCAKLRS